MAEHLRPSPAPLLLIAALLGGCACPEVGELYRYAGYDLATPDSALTYFQEAVLRGDIRHQYLVLSEALKRRVEEEQGRALSLQNYAIVAGDVREFLEERVGSLEDVFIGPPIFTRPDVAGVEVSSRDQRAVVQMILERGWSVYWKDPSRPPLHGILPWDADPARVADGRILFDLPLPPDAGPGDVYRLDYEAAWKVLGIEGSAFEADLARFLRQREAERLEKDAQAPPDEP